MQRFYLIMPIQVGRNFHSKLCQAAEPSTKGMKAVGGTKPIAASFYE
jgi:hypothetical protein